MTKLKSAEPGTTEQAVCVNCGAKRLEYFTDCGFLHFSPTVWRVESGDLINV